MSRPSVSNRLRNKRPLPCPVCCCHFVPVSFIASHVTLHIALHLLNCLPKNMFKLRIRESDRLKTVLELYDLEIHQKISKPDYQRLKTMVKRNINQKVRSRNFDARKRRIGTVAMVQNRRDQRGVERGPGECYQWKAKGQCSKRDSCSFRHGENKRAKPTPTSAPPSKPPTEKDGGNTPRRKSLRGRSLSGKFARQPRRDYIKAKCTRPSCDCWHPHECQFFKKVKRMQIR